MFENLRPRRVYFVFAVINIADPFGFIANADAVRAITAGYK